MLPSPSRLHPVREPLRRSSWMTSSHPAENIHILISDQTRDIGNEVLTVSHISKTVDGEKLLDDISFTVGHDDKIAFVGKNTKSTTMLFKILAGEEEPDEGSYKWGVTTSQGYFPKDNTKEFDNDLDASLTG